MLRIFSTIDLSNKLFGGHSKTVIIMFMTGKMGSIALNLGVRVVNFMFFTRWQWAKLKFAYLPHCMLEITMEYPYLLKVIISRRMSSQRCSICIIEILCNVLFLGHNSYACTAYFVR
ncbi:hypothetical protein CDAR_259461 [Caerostris darwini]|uniref:Uncharacterized protein n=1 Tax=Caerostris darwini TaxID=1538125 RepID=A0AAV4VMF9_9ARAC|nr:hypothetical protein CDAR_259461 [Caerostris darwini]